MTKAFGLSTWKMRLVDLGGVGLKGLVLEIQVEIWGRQLEKIGLEFREKVWAKAMDLGVISNRQYLNS